MILDLGTESFGNGSLFNQLKENAPLIKHFGPMYIDFDEYPPYSGGISGFLKNVNKIFSVIVVMLIIQASRKFAHGLMRKVGK